MRGMHGELLLLRCCAHVYTVSTTSLIHILLYLRFKHSPLLSDQAGDEIQAKQDFMRKSFGDVVACQLKRLPAAYRALEDLK